MPSKQRFAEITHGPGRWDTLIEALHRGEVVVFDLARPIECPTTTLEKIPGSSLNQKNEITLRLKKLFVRVISVGREDARDLNPFHRFSIKPSDKWEILCLVLSDSARDSATDKTILDCGLVRMFYRTDTRKGFVIEVQGTLTPEERARIKT